MSLLFLVMIVITLTAAQALSCSISTTCATGTFVLYLQNETGGNVNAHAQLPSVGTYAYGVCCTESGVTITTACDTTFAKLSDTTNAHVEIPTNTNYGTNACMNVSGRPLNCSMSTSCTGDATCLFSMKSSEGDNTTNSHIATCATYTNKLCCKVTSVPPTIVVNNTFTNLTTDHNFTVTAGVRDTDGGSDISNTTINYDSGTCTEDSSSTNGNYYNVTYNCQGTPYNVNTLNITFCDSTNNCVTTPSSSNQYPNQAPTMGTLQLPTNGNTTIHEVRPTFNWTNATDPESDSLHYQINISTTVACATVAITNTSKSEFIPAQDLCPDSVKNYTWTVRACDVYSDCSGWVTQWTFMIEPYVDLELLTSAINFSGMKALETKNTTDGIAPFTIRNNGNVLADLVNLTVSTSLWEKEALGTAFMRIKARAKEAGSYLSAVTSWVNLTTTHTNFINDFNYTDTTDEVYIDLEVTVPGDEPPGAKSTNITFVWESTPEYTQ